MAEQQSGKKQRKLKNIFVNGTFQTKIIILVAGITLMQGVMSVGFIYVAFKQFVDSWTNIVIESGDVLEAVKLLNTEVLIGVFIANAGFFLFALFMGIYFSHKIAGPNYAIKRAITNLLDGVDHHTVTLREGDEFHDLAEKINVMFAEYHLVKKADD